MFLSYPSRCAGFGTFSFSPLHELSIGSDFWQGRESIGGEERSSLFCVDVTAMGRAQSAKLLHKKQSILQRKTDSTVINVSLRMGLASKVVVRGPVCRASRAAARWLSFSMIGFKTSLSTNAASTADKGQP